MCYSTAHSNRVTTFSIQAPHNHLIHILAIVMFRIIEKGDVLYNDIDMTGKKK